MKYLIRTVERKDLSQLVELCNNHALYENVEYFKTGKEAKLERLLFLDNPVLHCLVVEVNDKLIGYASYTFDYSTWDAQVFLYLDCIYLEPGFRSLGIGEVIFNELKTIGQAKGCINIQWQTPVFNDKAIKFYKRIGATLKEKSRFTFSI